MGRRRSFPWSLKSPQILSAASALYTTGSGLPLARDNNKEPTQDINREGDLKQKWSFEAKLKFNFSKVQSRLRIGPWLSCCGVDVLVLEERALERPGSQSWVYLKVAG